MSGSGGLQGKMAYARPHKASHEVACMLDMDWETVISYQFKPEHGRRAGGRPPGPERGLRKLQPPGGTATPARAWGESPGSGTETRPPRADVHDTPGLKESSMPVGWVKRPTRGVQGRIGPYELPPEGRVAR